MSIAGKFERASRDRTGRAYTSGGRLAREQLRQECPSGDRALRAVEASDVVVVRGHYDQVERVLDALGLPFTAVEPEQVARASLRPEQLLIVNCPGAVDRAAVDRIRTFVEAGGSLFTTDWALRHVVEPAFPGVLAYNQRPTRDDVVRIEVRSSENPFLEGVLDAADDPQWWLEGSSYPIRILDPERVEVLLDSRELGERYGASPVAVLFRHGDGEVFHMISHYYLQRTELRTARHGQSAPSYFAEKGVAMDASTRATSCGLSLGEVESAATSSRMIANLVADKKRRMLEARERPATRSRRPRA